MECVWKEAWIERLSRLLSVETASRLGSNPPTSKGCRPTLRTGPHFQGQASGGLAPFLSQMHLKKGGILIFSLPCYANLSKMSTVKTTLPRQSRFVRIKHPKPFSLT